jgi:DNA methylase
MSSCDRCRCDEGYALPPLEVHWHEVPAEASAGGEVDRDGRGRLWRDAALGVTQAAREKRESLQARVAKLRELVDEGPGEHFLLWHDLEAERHAITAAVPEAVCVWGSQDLEERERRIIDFSEGRIQYLATKPVIAGSGCNFQRHCHRAIFTGIGFKFAELIQAIHRIHRFLQDRPVRIDLIYTEAERGIRADLERKWAEHDQLVARMGEIIRTYGLSHEALSSSLRRTLGVERQEASGEGWLLVNNDAVEETKQMASDSVHALITSIPFATQYEYSPSYNDFGHTEDNAHFWRQMDYLTPELLRVLKPGRVMVIHVKDRIVPGGMTGLGFQTVQPFHAEAIQHYMRHGFALLGMVTVVTDVVRENNQTYRLGWTEQCKDGSKMGCGMPEYLLIFRKPPSDASDGYADTPVVKSKRDYSRTRWQIDAHGFWRSNGNRPLLPQECVDLPHKRIFQLFGDHNLESVYDYEGHVALGEALEAKGRLPTGFMLLQPPSWHPSVWTDVARMRTLNMLQERKGAQMNLCPLQFDLVDRLITQYSMPGETVYDPFAGLMTVPYCAVKLGRHGIGVELNSTYWRDGAVYVEAAARKASIPTLFDLIEETA